MRQGSFGRWNKRRFIVRRHTASAAAGGCYRVNGMGPIPWVRGADNKTRTGQVETGCLSASCFAIDPIGGRALRKTYATILCNACNKWLFEPIFRFVCPVKKKIIHRLITKFLGTYETMTAYDDDPRVTQITHAWRPPRTRGSVWSKNDYGMYGNTRKHCGYIRVSVAVFGIFPGRGVLWIFTRDIFKTKKKIYSIKINTFNSDYFTVIKRTYFLNLKFVQNKN